MGFIDCDSHVIECSHTWEFFDPSEEQFKPVLTDGFLQFEEIRKQFPMPAQIEWMRDAFPAGSVDLSHPEARVRYMDEVGVDVQVLFPTFWLGAEMMNPVRDAAMARSYNRWLAEATADSGGRLGWAIYVPVLSGDRALQELDFGKEHGAVSVFLTGQPHGMSLANPCLWPIYEKAQDLDLAITIHIGGDDRPVHRDPGTFLHNKVLPLQSAFHALLTAGMTKRFPRLRWAFLEAGASWLPFVLQETFRADETFLRNFKDWRVSARETFQDSTLFVAGFMDDDIPYLLNFTGPDNMVHGTDFGHLDIGSDPNGLHTVANRSDLDPVVARKIVDDNARRLYGIDSSFQPAPAPTSEGLAVASDAAGT